MGKHENENQLPLPLPQLPKDMGKAGEPSTPPLWQPKHTDAHIEAGYSATAETYGVSISQVRDAITKYGKTHFLPFLSLLKENSKEDAEKLMALDETTSIE